MTQTLIYNHILIVEVEASVTDDQCSLTCSDDSKCGGPKGLVSVYIIFKAFSTLDLSLDVMDLRKESIATMAKEISTASNPVSTGEQIWIHAGIGEFNCSSFLPCDGDVTPGPPPTCDKAAATATTPLANCQKDGVAPPVAITVDYGDGSGEQLWQRENVQDVWTHSYSQPGIYTIFVMSM